MLTDDAAVVVSAANAILGLHDRDVAYADVFSPLGEPQLALALRALRIVTSAASLGADAFELVTPRYRGYHMLVYSLDVPEPCRRFAIRHGIGHVAAGHVTEPSFLSNRDDWMTHEERVADLFALADIFPHWLISDHGAAGSGWGGIKQALCRSLRLHTRDWPEPRVADRAELRLELYHRYML